MKKGKESKIEALVSSRNTASHAPKGIAFTAAAHAHSSYDRNAGLL
jgi:hypothetical protein